MVHTTWRNSTTHAAETKTVKRALLAAGLPVLRVTHGTGTAWSWLDIWLPENPSCLDHEKCDGPIPPPWICRGDCKACASNRATYNRAIAIAQEVTGRSGDYNGNINVMQQG